MKKAMAGLDAEQREALLYLADLGLAICSAALVVSLLQAMVDLVS
jgi:ABC-type nickel/cobalt efflux system permease component RcnA